MLVGLQLPSILASMILHPFEPQVVGCIDGIVYRFEIAGLEYGPLIVTAFRSRQKIEIHCPVCQHVFSIENEKLGSVITCPQENCSTILLVNPFVIQKPAPRKKNWLSKLLKE